MTPYSFVAVMVVCALQIRAFVISPLRLSDQVNLSPLPHPIQLDAASSSHFISKSNHILIRRGKESDRAASAAAIATQYKAAREINAAKLREEQEQRKADEKAAKLKRAAVETRRVAAELANRPVKTIEEIEAEEQARQASEKKTATNRANKMELKNKKIEAARKKQEEIDRITAAREADEMKSVKNQEARQAEIDSAAAVEKLKLKKIIREEKVVSCKKALDEATLECEEYHRLAEQRQAAYLSHQDKSKNWEEEEYQKNADELDVLERKLTDQLDPVLAEYLKEESKIQDYNPALTQWDLNKLHLDSDSIRVRYGDVEIPVAVQTKLEAHPTYIAAFKRFRTDQQSSRDELLRRRAAKYAELKREINLAELAEEDSKMKKRWWAKKVKRLTTELAAAQAAGFYF